MSAAASALQPSETGRRRERGILSATILGSSLAFVDSSVVNVALPAIEKGLAAEPAGLQWVVNAYLLPLGALVLLGGAAGDRYGRRRVFVAGVVLFVAASLAAMVAPSILALDLARAAQGVGSALLMPASLAILASAFEGERRGAAIGTWAAAGAVGGAIGPLLGGWLTDVVSWRAIFAINLPLGIAAVVLALRHMPEHDRATARPLDWSGAAVVTAGLGALTAGLTRLGETADAAVAALLLAAFGLFAVFLRIEAKKGEAAMVPLALFRDRTFSGVTLLTFLLYAALGGLVVLLPILLVSSRGYSATMAGFALLPIPVMLGLLSRRMGSVVGRVGARRLLTLGPLTVAAGFALFWRVGPQTSYAATILPALLAIALGMSLSVAPLTTTVMNAVDAAHAGVASGINNAVARIGGLVAVALIGLVLAAEPGDGAAFLAHVHAAALVGALLAAASALAAHTLVAEPVTPR